jgi:hypothetical protein
MTQNKTEKLEMKDPNDRKTVDGFADLVTMVEENQDVEGGTVPVRDLKRIVDTMFAEVPAPTKKKPGRKPAGNVALTPAEKQKAYRLRQKQLKLEQEVRRLEIRTGKPVTSEIIDLDTSFVDVYRTTRKP